MCYLGLHQRVVGPNACTLKRSTRVKRRENPRSPTKKSLHEELCELFPPHQQRTLSLFSDTPFEQPPSPRCTSPLTSQVSAHLERSDAEYHRYYGQTETGRPVFREPNWAPEGQKEMDPGPRPRRPTYTRNAAPLITGEILDLRMGLNIAFKDGLTACDIGRNMHRIADEGDCPEPIERMVLQMVKCNRPFHEIGWLVLDSLYVVDRDGRLVSDYIPVGQWEMKPRPGKPTLSYPDELPLKAPTPVPPKDQVRWTFLDASDDEVESATEPEVEEVGTAQVVTLERVNYRKVRLRELKRYVWEMNALLENCVL
ncbi:hypothetical protein BJX61DRAFT_544742 [Aspergillus egyptiacus]|nr:hypothetical protein BJX61DRAFT_544742 [Aspergillus egyptiacus]